MKINSIQSHNVNHSFKALRMRNGAETFLASLPPKAISKLDAVKEKLSDTKYYHLDIGKNDLSIYYTSEGERYYLPVLVNKSGKALLIKFRQGLTQISKKLKYGNTKEVNNICEKISKAQTQLERIAEVIKVLDDYELRLKQI